MSNGSCFMVQSLWLMGHGRTLHGVDCGYVVKLWINNSQPTPCISKVWIENSHTTGYISELQINIQLLLGNVNYTSIKATSFHI